MNTPARLPSPAARLRALAAQPVARNIGKVLTGNLAGNGLNMLAQMVISRVLDAGLFGMFSVLQRTMMFIGQFADLGLNTTIVKYYQQYARGGEREKAEALMRHALWLRLGLLGAMIALALALAGPLETLLITDERARGWMRLACAGAAGYALWMFCQAAMQAREQFGPYAVLGTANHALRLGLVAGFAWAGYLTLGAAVWIMVAVPNRGRGQRGGALACGILERADRAAGAAREDGGGPALFKMDLHLQRDDDADHEPGRDDARGAARG